MKILHITATHVNELGGIGSVLKGLVESQNKISGVESILISIRYQVDKERFRYLEYVPLNKLDSFIVEYNPDVAIIHSYFEPEYPKVARLLNKYKIEYFIEPHGGFMKGTYDKSRIKKHVADVFYFRRFLRKAYGVIFLNESEQRRSIRHFDREIIIPNGIKTANCFVEKKRKTKEKDLSLYYIGRYDIKGKGIDILLKSLKKLDKEGYQFRFELTK